VSESKVEAERSTAPGGLAVEQKESASAEASGKTFEVYMVHGTREDEASNPRYHQISAELAKRIRELPLRFTNYYLVTSKRCGVPLEGSRICELDDTYRVEIKGSADSQVEASVIRKGLRCAKKRQSLSQGEFLVFGGNSSNSSCWLVLVKRVE